MVGIAWRAAALLLALAPSAGSAGQARVGSVRLHAGGHHPQRSSRRPPRSLAGHGRSAHAQRARSHRTLREEGNGTLWWWDPLPDDQRRHVEGAHWDDAMRRARSRTVRLAAPPSEHRHRDAHRPAHRDVHQSKHKHRNKHQDRKAHHTRALGAKQHRNEHEVRAHAAQQHQQQPRQKAQQKKQQQSRKKHEAHLDSSVANGPRKIIHTASILDDDDRAPVAANPRPLPPLPTAQQHQQQAVPDAGPATLPAATAPPLPTAAYPAAAVVGYPAAAQIAQAPVAIATSVPPFSAIPWQQAVAMTAPGAATTTVAPQPAAVPVAPQAAFGWTTTGVPQVVAVPGFLAPPVAPAFGGAMALPAGWPGQPLGRGPVLMTTTPSTALAPGYAPPMYPTAPR